MFFDEVHTPTTGINRVPLPAAPPQPSRHHAVRVVKAWTMQGGAGEAYFDLPGVSAPGIGPDPADGQWKVFFNYAQAPDPFPVPPGAQIRVLVE